MCKSMGDKPNGVMKVKIYDRKLRFRIKVALSTDPIIIDNRFEFEHIRQDPKDGELCLHRVKSEEILVEARSDTDVQIVRQMWVQRQDGSQPCRSVSQGVGLASCLPKTAWPPTYLLGPERW